MNPIILLLSKIVISILLSLPLSAFGQRVFDIKADLIQLDSSGFQLYKKALSGEYYRIDLELHQLFDFEYMLHFYTELIEAEEVSKSAFPVSMLQDTSPKELSSEQSSIYHQYKENYFQELSYCSQAFFMVKNYILSNALEEGAGKKIWRTEDIRYYNYCILRINQEKQLCILIEYDFDNTRAEIEGVFAKTEEGFIGFLDMNLYNSKDKQKFTSNKNIIYPNLSIGQEYPIYRVSEKNELRDYVFDQKLIAESYDSLYVKNDFVVGIRNKSTDVFNYKLQKISPLGARSASIQEDGQCQILIGNKIRWLRPSGKISAKPEERRYVVCGSVNTTSKEIRITEDSIIIDKASWAFGWEDSPDRQTYQFKNQNFEDIYFLNHSKALTFDGNSGSFTFYQLPQDAYHLLITKQKGQYGLALYDEERLQIREILSPQYDSIIFESAHHPILLQRGNLYGYYPMSTTPRYRHITKFDHSFAQFTLSNGKKGWLDLKGREYLDE